MITIVRSHCCYEPDIYISQFCNLTLFPIASKSFEANSRNFFTFCREHVLQEVFLQRLQLVELTLMKGDEIINISNISANFYLFILTCSSLQLFEQINIA